MTYKLQWSPQTHCRFPLEFKLRTRALLQALGELQLDSAARTSILYAILEVDGARVADAMWSELEELANSDYRTSGTPIDAADV